MHLKNRNRSSFTVIISLICFVITIIAKEEEGNQLPI